jgi:tetratricopeptide (TPR) repeat protein
LIRLLSIILGVLLAAGAGAALKALDPSRQPEVVALEPSDQSPLPPQQVIALLTEAVSRDSANPYRWADLGQALVNSNDIPKARTCYTRALELSRDIPQIWLRDANFHFQLGEPEQALDTASRVLKTVPDYDAILFGYFTQFGLKAPVILSKIGDDRRAVRSYTQYLIDHNVPDDATVAWRHAAASAFSDERLTASYIDCLLRARRYDQAQSDWLAFLGENRDGYPEKNLVFNGGFERVPTPSVFDWRIQPADGVETVRDPSGHDGHWALRVKFDGKSNVSFNNVSELIRIHPGAHRLRAWVRTQGITTNEGPRLEVQDAESAARLDIRTEPFLGTQDWHLVQQAFTVPSGTNLVAVRVVRQPSQKFDNKIAGVFWLDSVELVNY